MTIAPPPGWYADPAGAMRWWDGQQWGPAAPVTSETESGKTLAIISHIGVLTGGFLLPLVIRLTEGRKNSFARHHSTEALNFQITFMLAWFVAFTGLIVAGAVSPAGSTSTAVIVVFLLASALFLANIALSILGCVRASQERWWRYPVSIRFVRGR